MSQALSEPALHTSNKRDHVPSLLPVGVCASLLHETTAGALQTTRAPLF